MGKNRKKVRKIVFYIHTNIVFKKRGQKNARNNFSRNKRIVRAKNVGEKIVGKKCEKSFFILTRISWPKNGGEKNAWNNFSINTRVVRAKNVGEKIVGKKWEKRFFILTRISWQKKGGKRAKHTNSASKKWGKNRRKKVRKTFFYIHTNIVTKK